MHKVLLVDDDHQVLNILKSHLCLGGLELATATDAETAFELTTRDRFHAVLIDIDLPGRSGMELLKRIKHASPSTQVMMMTAYATVEKAAECLDAGATDYILKPFRDLREITTKVRLACDHVSRRDNAARRGQQHIRPGENC